MTMLKKILDLSGIRYVEIKGSYLFIEYDLNNIRQLELRRQLKQINSRIFGNGDFTVKNGNLATESFTLLVA